MLAEQLREPSEYRREALRYGMAVAQLRMIAVEDHLAALGASIAHGRILLRDLQRGSHRRRDCGLGLVALRRHARRRKRFLRCLTDRFFSLGQQLKAAPAARKPSVRASMEDARDKAVNAGAELARNDNSWRTA